MEKSGIDIKHIALHVRHTLWLPTTEAQDTQDRDINLHIEDTEGINIGPDNDNESNSGLDTTIAFGGSEGDGYLSKLIPSNQAKLTVLMREIQDLHQ